MKRSRRDKELLVWAILGIIGLILFGILASGAYYGGF